MLSVHERTVARLVRKHPQASVDGFARTVREIFRDYGDSYSWPLAILPDLFWFDAGAGDCDSGTITCVEDGNPISAHKLTLYYQLWFALDSVNCELRLFVSDRWGERLTQIPIHEYHPWRRE